MLGALDIAIVTGVALVAGVFNAIAGGGRLFMFPTLVALGVPAVTANVTSTVALCPGFLGASYAQRRDLIGQGKRMARLVPVAIVGGAAGAVLLLASSEGAFNRIVPYLLLLSALLVAVQGKVRALLLARSGLAGGEVLAIVPVALAATYGGYFGAALGVILLGALGIVLSEHLLRINALKQVLSLAVNVAASIVFVAWGEVDWLLALVIALGSLVGGAFGGILSRRIPDATLRWVVIILGLIVAVIYFVR